MTPTNDQIAEHLKALNNRIEEIGEFAESVAFAFANHYKLVAAKATGFSDEERAVLTIGALKCLKSVEKQQFLRKQFRDSVQLFSKN